MAAARVKAIAEGMARSEGTRAAARRVVGSRDANAAAMVVKGRGRKGAGADAEGVTQQEGPARQTKRKIHRNDRHSGQVNVEAIDEVNESGNRESKPECQVFKESVKTASAFGGVHDLCGQLNQWKGNPFMRDPLFSQNRAQT